MNLESLLTFIREKSAVKTQRPSNCKDCSHDQDCFVYFNTVMDEGYYCNTKYQGNTGCCMRHTPNNSPPPVIQSDFGNSSGDFADSLPSCNHPTPFTIGAHEVINTATNGTETIGDGCFSNSTVQGFYYIDTFPTDSPSLTPEDWIGSFSPSSGLLTGARQVHPSNSKTDIPVMGDDGWFYSVGYMNIGELPVFKIYQASTGLILNATVDTPMAMAQNPMYMVGAISTDGTVFMDTNTTQPTELPVSQEKIKKRLIDSINKNQKNG